MVAAEPDSSGRRLAADGQGGAAAARATNLSSLVTEQAARQPDRIALVEPGARSRTWRQLDDAVATVAAGLAGTGLVAGQRIGLDGGNSVDWVVAYLAALRAGLVVVPTDPDEPVPERDELLAATGVRAVLSTRPATAEERVPTLELSEDGLTGLAAAEAALVTPPDPEALAVLVATLGTSADRKIVALSHRALLAHLEQVAGYGIVDTASVVLGALPFFHAYGLNAVLGTCLAAGAQLVIPDAGTWDLASVIEAERVDRLPLTPGLLYRLLQDDGSVERLGGIRQVVVGGAPVPWRLARRFAERTGLRVERAYGLSEAAPGVTSTVGGEILGPAHVGRALPGVEVRIGAGLDPGEPGEIAIRGRNLFSGYWPEGSGGPDPDGWFATGDIGYLSDGELFLVDRTREVISVQGFTVYPSEVEQLIRSLPEVEAVAVVARPPEAGSGLVAFVAGPEATREVVTDFIATRLPAFKRPQEVRMVDDLPRGVTGVVRRDRLRRELATPAGTGNA